MFQTLVLLASLSAPAEAPTVTNKVFVVENKIPASYDPYGHKSYQNFEQSILVGVGRGKLAVGVADPWVSTYENHCRVDSGALPGVADGLYECYRDSKTGKAMMVPWSPPKAMGSATPVLDAIGNVVKYCTKSGCYYVPAK